MPAGRYRERVILQERGAPGTGSESGGEGGGDGYGNSEGAWVERFRCAARILPLKGRDEITAQRLQGVQPVVITIRASAAAREVNSDWRALDARSGRSYAIRSVTETERRDAIELLCEAGLADG